MTDNNEIIHVQGENLPVDQNNGFDSNSLIQQFLADQQDVMESSKESYEKSLKKYFAWVKESGYLLQNVTLTEILQYKKHLEQRKTKDGTLLSKYTIGAYLVAIKRFYEWANGKGLMINPAKSIKSPKREAKFKRSPLNEEQIARLFEYFEKKGNLRDIAIVKTLYYCGLRTIEVVRLDYEDIEIKETVRRIRVMGKGKTEKDKWVKFLDHVFKPVMQYLETRKDLTPKSPLFISESVITPGGRLDEATISRIAKKGLRAIGLSGKEYTAHSLRHSAATNAMRKGASLSNVQDMLRHASSATTQGYAHAALEEKRLHEKGAEDFL